MQKLTMSHIRDMSNEKTFPRGELLYQSGAIFDATREGDIFDARCTAGSRGRPYTLRAQIKDGVLKEIRCNCPYEFDGLCKHQVAFLLTFVNKPTFFITQEPMEAVLESYSREQLLNLVISLANQSMKNRKLIMRAAKKSKR